MPNEDDRPVVTAERLNTHLLRPGLRAQVRDTAVIAWRPVLERLKAMVRAVPVDTWVHHAGRPQWVSTCGVPRPISLFELPVGAPAAAALVEIAAAAGAVRFLCAGAAGALDDDCHPGSVVAAVAAFGADGTTPHYWPHPPQRPVSASPDLLAGLAQACRAEGVDLRSAPVCTTDAWFRETPALIARWTGWGAVAVEMETAAVYATARRIGVQAASLLYVTDDLAHGVWDPGAGVPRFAAQTAGICRGVLRLCTHLGEGSRRTSESAT